MHKYMMWAGTEASLAEYKEKLKNLPDMSAYKGEEESEERSSNLLSIHGNVGVISVRGPLVSTDSWFNDLLGIVSYNAISNALVEAAELPGVHSIMLDIDSPGGAVNGVADTSDLIKYVDKSIKPVYSYTSGSMCSAAYWLGSSAREIYASRIANVGSIGVITTSIDITKSLEKEGITATVIRAGKYKQMGNPYEELTEEGKGQIQALVDDVYKIFVKDVANGRGKSYQFVDEYMAQGRVMLSESAKTVGLIDDVMTFDQALITISKRTLDKRNLSFENNNNNLGATMKHKKSLVGAVYQDLVQVSAKPATKATEAPIVDSKITMDKLEDLIASEPKAVKPETQDQHVEAKEDNTTEVKLKVSVDASEALESVKEAQEDLNSLVVLDDGTVVDVKEESAVELEAVEAVEAVEDSEDVKAEDTVTADSGAMDVLFKQLEAKDERISDLRLELAKSQEKLEAFEAMEDGLRDIVARATQGMQIALGQPRTDFAEASLQSIVDAHATVSATFSKSFKAGQRSVTSVKDVDSPNKKDDVKSFKDMTALQRASATSL